MTAGKSERLLNLLIMLLVQRRYVAKERSGRSSTRTRRRTRSRRCSSGDKDELPQPGRPDRGRPDRSLSSTTSRATGSGPTSSRVPTSASPPTRPPWSPRPTGLAARAAGRGHHRGGPAHRAGRRRGPDRPRHRRAAADRRRAVVRRVLGGDPGAHAGDLRLLRSGGTRCAPATCTRGVARYSGRSTSSVSTPIRRWSGSSTLPGPGPATSRAGRAPTRSRPAPT